MCPLAPHSEIREDPMRRFAPIILLAAALALGNAARAEPAYTGSYFAVIVSDIDASVAWYEAHLGVTESTRLADAGRYEIVNMVRPGLFVELLELADAATPPDGRVRGPFKLGALVADLDAIVAALPAAADAPGIVEDANNGLRLLQLRDPDGNVVQLMQLLD